MDTIRPNRKNILAYLKQQTNGATVDIIRFSLDSEGSGAVPTPSAILRVLNSLEWSGLVRELPDGTWQVKSKRS